MTFRRRAIMPIALALSIASAVTPSLYARADTLFGDELGAMSPMPSRSASRIAREELSRARLMLTRARIASGRLEQTIAREFREAGGYRALQINAAHAISAYQAARREPIAGLARDPEYTRLSREREALRLQMRRVADQKKASFETLMPLARQALEKGERITRSESIVLAMDPNVEDARANMNEAFAALRQVTREATAQAAEYPEVTMAREDVAIARERVTIANRNLVAALRAEAAEDRARRNGRSGRG